MEKTMSIRMIILAKDGGEPTVSVFIAQAQYGEYTVKLKDPSSGQRVTQAEGDNADDIADTFRLKKRLAALDQHLLSWWITIPTSSEEPGQFYFARVSVNQNDRPVSGGIIEYMGPLNDTKNIVDVARLIVQ
jgi:hypothetical protein